MRKGNDTCKNNHVKVDWLNRMNEKMSLIALGIGVGIGFGGVVAIFTMWQRAKCWLFGISANKPQFFYGMYRPPT